MAIIQISKIQVRTGNVADLPQLSAGEFGWADDERRLFIGNDANRVGDPDPNNTEILTKYSPIELNGNVTIANVANFSLGGEITDIFYKPMVMVCYHGVQYQTQLHVLLQVQPIKYSTIMQDR